MLLRDCYGPTMMPHRITLAGFKVGSLEGHRAERRDNPRFQPQRAGARRAVQVRLEPSDVDYDRVCPIGDAGQQGLPGEQLGR